MVVFICLLLCLFYIYILFYIVLSSLQVRSSATTMRKRKGKLFNDEELEKLKTKCNAIIEMGPITEDNSW